MFAFNRVCVGDSRLHASHSVTNSSWVASFLSAERLLLQAYCLSVSPPRSAILIPVHSSILSKVNWFGNDSIQSDR